MPPRSVGLCNQSSNAMVELGGGPDTFFGQDSEVLFGAFNSKRVSHERCATILRRLLLRRTFETRRPGRSDALGAGLRRLECCLFRDMTNQGVLGPGVTRLDPGR
jgi:hypothetical protein